MSYVLSLKLFFEAKPDEHTQEEVLDLIRASLPLKLMQCELRQAYKDEHMSMTPRRVHAFEGSKLPTSGRAYAACGFLVSAKRLTHNQNKVTCKICKKLMMEAARRRHNGED